MVTELTMTVVGDLPGRGSSALIAAAAQRAAPKWVLAFQCSTAAAARQMAYSIRSGKRAAVFQPAGSFQAEHRDVQVFVRFVGGELN